jgi:hypothetical protein
MIDIPEIPLGIFITEESKKAARNVWKSLNTMPELSYTPILNGEKINFNVGELESELLIILNSEYLSITYHIKGETDNYFNDFKQHRAYFNLIGDYIIRKTPKIVFLERIDEPKEDLEEELHVGADLSDEHKEYTMVDKFKGYRRICVLHKDCSDEQIDKLLNLID